MFALKCSIHIRMIWKYLEQNILFPKSLNWIQHWVSWFDYFDAKLGLNIDTFLTLMETRSIWVNLTLGWWTFSICCKGNALWMCPPVFDQFHYGISWSKWGIWLGIKFPRAVWLCRAADRWHLLVSVERPRFFWSARSSRCNPLTTKFINNMTTSK